jgi:hypothetical protein
VESLVSVTTKTIALLLAVVACTEGCAAPIRYAVPAANDECASSVVREALPITEGDESILLDAGARVLGEMVLDEGRGAPLDEQRRLAASRATCMGGTHFRLVQRRSMGPGGQFPPTFVVYRVPGSHFRFLPTDLTPVPRGS